MVGDGVRSFIVGTGGTRLHNNDYQKKWSFTEAYDLNRYGILKIVLFENSYQWEFITASPSNTSIKVIKTGNADSCNIAH
jgi:hypothetical protein